MVEVNQDVSNNATTESVSTMKLKTLLHSCTVDNINIVLFSYSHKPNYTVETTNIKIRSRISEHLKHYIDELINKYDDCDLEELTEEQKENLMILIRRVSFMIVTELSE